MHFDYTNFGVNARLMRRIPPACVLLLPALTAAIVRETSQGTALQITIQVAAVSAVVGIAGKINA
jgi:hypothetical protein